MLSSKKAAAAKKAASKKKAAAKKNHSGPPPKPKPAMEEVFKVICKLHACPAINSSNLTKDWVGGKREFNPFTIITAVKQGSKIKHGGEDAAADRGGRARSYLAWYAAFNDFVQSNQKSKKKCKSWARDLAKLLMKPTASMIEKSNAILQLCKEQHPMQNGDFDKKDEWVRGRQPFNLYAFFRKVKSGALDALYCTQYQTFIAVVIKCNKNNRKKVPAWAKLEVEKLKKKNSAALKSTDKKVIKKMKAWTDASNHKVTESAIQALAKENRKVNAEKKATDRKSSGFYVCHATPAKITSGYLRPQKAEGKTTKAAVWVAATASQAVMRKGRAASSQSKEQLEWASEAARFHASKKVVKSNKGTIYLYKIEYGHPGVKEWISPQAGTVGKHKRPMLYSTTRISLLHHVVKETWRFDRPKPSSSFESMRWDLVDE